ncbi:hypothetical protein [Paraburkholderia silvatlantica]|uniref:phage tail fiber protein n=1 Tax=Paraburkholderia silvatlantica TaxID=321895 RepID=UPI00375011AB
MTQSTSYQVPAHPSGLEMRTQLNVIVLAMLGDNCGPAAPAEMYPGMMWGDTTTNMLKRRTNANDAWVTIGPLDDFLGDVRKAANDANAASANKVSKTGDTMTGALISTAIDTYRQKNGAYSTFWRNDGDSLYLMKTAPNNPDGTFDGYRPFRLHLPSGQVTLCGDGATTLFGGRFNAYGRCLIGTKWGEGGEIGLQAADGWQVRLRARNGGGIEMVNNAYNGVPLSLDDGGNCWIGNVYSRGECYSGGARLCQDGNIYGSIWGDYLSNWLNNNKAPRAQCQHDSGLAEFGNIVQGDSGHGECSCPAPWVMVGLRGARWETWIRGIVLRNA